MTRWLLLALTVVSEVTASLSLKAAIDQPAWFAVVAVGYVLAFFLLSVVLRLGMPLGATYGIWAASGVALTAVMSAVIFGEALTPLMVGGIALIAAGVLCVELGAQAAERRRAAEVVR